MLRQREKLEVLYNKILTLSGSLSGAETIPAITSDPTLQTLRQEILKADQHILEISKKYGEKHPAMIRARGDLKILEKKKAMEIKRIIASIKNEYELARSHETNLRDSFSATKKEAQTINEESIQYRALKREVESNRQLYDLFIKKIKEQDITEKVQTISVWIVKKATPPGAPVKPDKRKNILLGIMGGLLAEIGLAFALEYLDNTIKSPEDAEAKLGVSTLAMIMQFKLKSKRVEHIVIEEPSSVFAENYKALRTAIMLSSADSHPRTLLVTSMNKEEGKTVTSINLAAAIALSQHKVLLIDSDLRRPRIHKVFGLDNSTGLSTYLAGVSGMDITQEGPIENLTFIPAGPIPPNPSELLSSHRMNELIKHMTSDFDMVIFDSPPLMSVTDALILSKILDATVIVTREGVTTYEIAKRALKSNTHE